MLSAFQPQECVKLQPFVSKILAILSKMLSASQTLWASCLHIHFLSGSFWDGLDMYWFSLYYWIDGSPNFVLTSLPNSNYQNLFLPIGPLFFPPSVSSTLWASQVALVVKNPPANAGHSRDVGSVPGSEKSPEEGNGNPLQYSCLENLTDRGTWRATVHGVTKSSDTIAHTQHHQLSMEKKSHSPCKLEASGPSLAELSTYGWWCVECLIYKGWCLILLNWGYKPRWTAQLLVTVGHSGWQFILSFLY